MHLREVGVISHLNARNIFLDGGYRLLDLDLHLAENPEIALHHLYGPVNQVQEDRQHAGLEQPVHLARDAGQKEEPDALVFQGETARGTAGVQDRGPHGNRGHLAAAGLPDKTPFFEAPFYAADHALVLDQLEIQRRRGLGHRQVVVGGAQAPGDDDETGAAQGPLQQFTEQGRTIPQGGDALHHQPGFVEPPGGIPGVHLGHLPRDQLRPRENNFALHKRPL